jgi:CII-binding regulator of phage lambda lysogenization HflD
MSRMKKTVSHVEQAVTRLAALKSIDVKMDMGNGLDIPKYETAIKDLQTKLERYNTTLSMVDEQLNQVQVSELTLRDLSERMLAGVASKYGKNSDEYEKAGGKKKSERRRRSLKKEAG